MWHMNSDTCCSRTLVSKSVSERQAALYLNGRRATIGNVNCCAMWLPPRLDSEVNDSDDESCDRPNDDDAQRSGLLWAYLRLRLTCGRALGMIPQQFRLQRSVFIGGYSRPSSSSLPRRSSCSILSDIVHQRAEDPSTYWFRVRHHSIIS